MNTSPTYYVARHSPNMMLLVIAAVVTMGIYSLYDGALTATAADTTATENNYKPGTAAWELSLPKAP